MKKKIFICFIILFFITSSCVKAEDIYKQLPLQCKTFSLDNENTFSLKRIINKNFVTKKICELMLASVVKKHFGTFVAVNIVPISIEKINDIKFERMVISGNNLNFSGVYFSDFIAKTVCNYNHFIIQDDDIFIKEDFLMEFSGSITNQDLAKMMNSKEYLDLINNSSIKVFGQELIKLKSLNISIDEDSLLLNVKIDTPLLSKGSEKQFILKAGLKVIDGKIMYKNIKGDSIQDEIFSLLINLMNLANPFNIKIKISENSNGYTYIKDVIINNRININGILYIPKNE